jgi:hypothetical protein
MTIYQWSQASKSKLVIQVYLCSICIILVLILEINVTTFIVIYAIY